MRPVWAVKAIIVVVFTSTLIRCVCGANLTVGGASGWDLNSNMQDCSSTTTFNAGDNLVTALQDLHRTLNYPPVLQGWNGGDPCGESWTGVACSAVTSITHLKIQGFNLTWYLGGLLHSLQYLEHIDNNIVCEIPYGLPPNNTHINMACNYLRKNIPHLFATMKKLSHLNLSHNFLHGPIGNVFTGVDNLKEMGLSYNNFTRDLPSSIGSFSNLSLLIGGNKFYPLEGVLLEHNTSPPPTTQENAKENFVSNKVIKNKNPMGRVGIGFMVGGGTLLIFLFVASHKLLRLRSFKSNRSSLASHLVRSRRNKLKYRGPKIGNSQASSSSENNPPNKYAVLVGECHVEDTGKVSIATSSYEFMPVTYWSNLINKVPVGVTLTVIVNTCMAGAFFKEAQTAAENRGNVIVFCSCEENNVTFDGEFYFTVLKPILQRKRNAPLTNLQVSNSIKQAMNNRNVPFYCPQNMNNRVFLDV